MNIWIYKFDVVESYFVKYIIVYLKKWKIIVMNIIYYVKNFNLLLMLWKRYSCVIIIRYV